jgi:hypothetical protein
VSFYGNSSINSGPRLASAPPIGHRYHKREFLLKFSKDRHRWPQWLYEARKRYDLTILKESENKQREGVSYESPFRALSAL